MKEPERQGEKKELLFITGAMRHDLHDDNAALVDLEEALTLKLAKKG